jgi:hypothetical protein
VRSDLPDVSAVGKCEQGGGELVECRRPRIGVFSASVPILLTAQLLGGISAAAVTVLTILVITDLTTGTGRFNLVRGAVGTLIFSRRWAIGKVF